MAEVFPSIEESPVQGPMLPQQQPMLTEMPTPIPSAFTPDPEVAAQGMYAVQQAKQQGIIDSAQQSLLNAEKQQNSFMSKAIPIAAALRGNFGPLMMLEEQKRKTAIGKAIFPQMVKINELKNSGDLEGAISLANSLAGGLGERAPEVVNLLTKVADDLGKRQYNFGQMQTIYDIMNPVTPKDHPNRGVLDAIGKAAKARSPLSEQLLGSILTHSQIHPTIAEGQVVGMSPMTMQTQFTPIPQVQQAKDVRNWPGLSVGKAYGLTPMDVLNSMNGIAVKTDTGEVIEPGSEKAKALRTDMVGLQDVTASLEHIAPLVNIEPIIMTQLLENVDPVNAAMRKFKGEMSPALGRHFERIRQTDAAKEQAKIDVDPFLARSHGMSYVDVSDPSSPNFGREHGTLTYREAQASRGGFVPLRTEIIDKEFHPALKAKQGLAFLPELLAAQGSWDQPLEKLGKSINIAVSNWLQVPVASGITVRKAAEMIVKDSIEEVEKTSDKNRAEVGVLKNMITSGFTPSAESIDAANMLMRRVNQTLARHIEQNRIPDTMIPESFKKGRPETTPTPEPGSPEQKYKLPPWLDKAHKGYEEELKRREKAGQPTYQHVDPKTLR